MKNVDAVRLMFASFFYIVKAAAFQLHFFFVLTGGYLLRCHFLCLTMCNKLSSCLAVHCPPVAGPGLSDLTMQFVAEVEDGKWSRHICWAEGVSLMKPTVFQDYKCTYIFSPMLISAGGIHAENYLSRRLQSCIKTLHFIWSQQIRKSKILSRYIRQIIFASHIFSHEKQFN